MKPRDSIKIKYIIPSGTAIQNARTSIAGDHLNRDGYHLDLGFGQFTAACAWYGALTGRDVTASSYMPEGMNADLVAVARLPATLRRNIPRRIYQSFGDEAVSCTLQGLAGVPVEMRRR